jgi:aminoglycoside phosphotransferase family enzyme
MRRTPPPTLDEKLAFLRDPRSYGEAAVRIETIETHFAWVFLTARHAYKLKKPLRQVAMDYRTVAARRKGCRAEITLNRRLAPSVYLGVVPLAADARGALSLGRGGRVVDWLVKMRRLPASGLLDHILDRQSITDAQVDRLVALLVRFFRQARRSPMPGRSYLGRLRRQLAANRRALRSYGSQLRQVLADEVSDAQREFLAIMDSGLGARGAHVVEGHGDLRPEHVCVGRPLCVIDCVEFDRDLRLSDPVEELAFLALEVERLGHRPLAAKLVRRYCEMRGDRIADAVVHFYMSHRASTRAKLAAWHIGDPQFPDPQPWIARAHSYLRDALRHARRALRLGGPLRTPVRGRPAFEQRRKRNAAQDSRQGFANERRDRQDRELVAL